jgi:CheY-like chemotaxis protein
LALTDPSSTTNQPRHHEAPPAVPRRVLVVDDSRDARVLLAVYLRQLGHEVEMAENGTRALEIAIRFRPEFAFVDLILPDIDGADLVRELLAELGSSVRCFAVTAYGGDQERIRTRAAGCEAHVLKPVDPLYIQSLLDSMPEPVSSLQRETVDLLQELEQFLSGLLNGTPPKDRQARSRLEHLIAMARRVRETWSIRWESIDARIQKLEAREGPIPKRR